MKKSLLLSSLLAIALVACGKKEAPPAPAAPAAEAPAAPAAAPAAPAADAAAPAAEAGPRAGYVFFGSQGSWSGAVKGKVQNGTKS